MVAAAAAADGGMRNKERREKQKATSIGRSFRPPAAAAARARSAIPLYIRYYDTPSAVFCFLLFEEEKTIILKYAAAHIRTSMFE